MLAGAAVGAGGQATPTAAWPAALAVASLALLPRPGSMRAALWLLAAGLAAAGHTAQARGAALSPPLARWFAAIPDPAAPGAPVVVTGLLAEDAAPARGGGVRLLLEVNAVRSDGAWMPLAGRVQVHVAGGLGDEARGTWTRGRRLQAPVALRWPAYVRNPGSPSIEWQTLSRDFVLLGSIKSAALVDVTRAAWWDERAADVRQHVRQRAQALLEGHPRAEAILVAILIGDRSGLDPEVEERLLNAGTYHVIAISGGNVAILTMLVVGALRLFTRSARLVSVAAIAVVAAYGWIVGGDPSVTRAVVAAIVWLAAGAAGLAAAPLHVLATVIVVVVIADPLIVIEPGAWLSFGATFGILAFVEPCSRYFLRAERGSRPNGLARVWATVAGIIGATLAVELVLLPVGLFVFSRTSLAGPLMNIIAIPAMAVAQVAGMFAVALPAAVPGIAAGLAFVARLAIDVIVESPRMMAGVPWVSWRAPAPPWPWAVLFYAAAITTVLATTRPRLRRWAGWTLVLALAGLCLAPRDVAVPRRPGWLRVIALDVGQGEALLVQFPRGKTLLVDAGNATETFDAGDRVVTPALWALGTTRLDWAAFSHADRDHAGGLSAVAAAFRPREMWEGVPVPSDGTRRELLESASLSAIAWRELRRGDRLVMDDVTVEVLHPEAPDWERRRVRNDDSVVLRLRFGDFEMLLTGDIGAGVERTLARQLDDDDRRTVRVLKVAHHGSRTSTSDALLSAYRPGAAVVSAGRNNPFGHPAPDVIGRLRDRAVPVFRTDRDGAVSVETDGREVRLSTWTGRAWSATVEPGRRPA